VDYTKSSYAFATSSTQFFNIFHTLALIGDHLKIRMPVGFHIFIVISSPFKAPLVS